MVGTIGTPKLEALAAYPGLFSYDWSHFLGLALPMWPDIFVVPGASHPLTWLSHIPPAPPAAPAAHGVESKLCSLELQACLVRSWSAC